MLPFVLLAALAAAPALPAELAAVEDSMRHRLKDPDSMQVENVRTAPGSMPTMRVACGEVNARNSFGGYVGRRTFYALLILRDGQPPGAVVVGVDDGRTNVASDMCRKAGL